MEVLRRVVCEWGRGNTVSYELDCHHLVDVPVRPDGHPQTWPCPHCAAAPTAEELDAGAAVAHLLQTEQTSALPPWRTCILEGKAEELDAVLAIADRHGYDVRFVLPNGVNRWTVITRLKHDVVDHEDDEALIAESAR
jgi:hypothetical protein